VKKNPELQAAKMVTHVDRKDSFPHKGNKKKAPRVPYSMEKSFVFLL
jgi:hypothetical protein